MKPLLILLPCLLVLSGCIMVEPSTIPPVSPDIFAELPVVRVNIPDVTSEDLHADGTFVPKTYTGSSGNGLLIDSATILVTQHQVDQFDSREDLLKVAFMAGLGRKFEIADADAVLPGRGESLHQSMPEAEQVKVMRLSPPLPDDKAGHRVAVDLARDLNVNDWVYLVGIVPDRSATSFSNMVWSAEHARRVVVPGRVVKVIGLKKLGVLCEFQKIDVEIAEGFSGSPVCVWDDKIGPVVVGLVSGTAEINLTFPNGRQKTGEVKYLAR